MTLLVHRPRAVRGPALAVPFSAGEWTTPRLTLRPYRMTDADDWLAIEADPAVREGLGWPERTGAQALRHLRHRTHHTALAQAGDLLVLAVVRDGHVIGDVSLHLRTVAAETRSLEIGWLQRSSQCGQGFATEAADAMLDIAFGEVGACLVAAVVRADNAPSARLAQRLGLHLAARTAAYTTFVVTRSERRLPSRRARTGQQHVA
ncbi:GNAT family N-acetyltransferase [Leifsonia sp. AG29]|uniref:GNAT family N-acetyltransferase n=1 Tax=Leifsonia sp. AG29 TaxID=2598860 RepID=UPI00131BED22|nr:GNAT family N-acetyltransferase [Leifsonia sp. AG29]